MYKPDNWVVVRSPQDGHMRVLAGWSGGYTQGSSWRLNSGIVSCEETEHTFTFRGYTGSSYACSKDGYGLRTSNIFIWETLKEKGWELMEEATEWAKVDYKLDWS